jgi:hypothetical protein
VPGQLPGNDGLLFMASQLAAYLPQDRRQALAQGAGLPDRTLRAVVETLRAAINYTRAPLQQSVHDETVAAARKGLSMEAFSTVWASSQALPLDDAIALALSPAGHPPAAL